MRQHVALVAIVVVPFGFSIWPFSVTAAFELMVTLPVVEPVKFTPIGLSALTEVVIVTVPCVM